MASRPNDRGGVRAPFAAALMAAIALAAPAVAQRIPERSVPTPIEFATGEADNLFSIGRSQDDIHEWEQGIAELTNGDPKLAVDRLHKLLQRETGGVAPVAPGRFLGLRLAVVTTMANMSPAANEAYEALVQREAGNLANRPLHDLEPDQLAMLARRFPVSTIGRRARLHLGDLAFEAGRGAEAADHYRQALDASPIGSADERRAAERLQCAGVMCQPVTARARAAAKELDAAGSDVLTALPPTTDPTGYRALGGIDGRLPMIEPAGRPRSVIHEDVSAAGFDFADTARFAMFPVGDLDNVYVNTGTEVLAVDPARKGVTCLFSSPLGDGDRGEQVNKDMVLAASYGGDVVVAALQVPDNSVNVDFQNAYRIISKIPLRRLHALSRRTGKLLWSHYDEIDGPRTKRFRGHDSCAPPIVVGDTVYAPVHDRSGAIAFSIAAYDLATGQPKWRQLICSSQQDVNMFGNARMEFASSPLTVADGVIYGATNLGVAFALESATGRIRWITSYEVIRMPRTALHGQAERPVYFANNAPALADGIVCMTPLDSQFVLGFDAETGQLAWRLSTDAVLGEVENRVRWLVGALGDEFVLAGRGAIAVAARLDTAVTGKPKVRQLVRPETLRVRSDDDFVPRPALTADHVWFALPGRIVGFDRAGNEVDEGRQIVLPDYQPGNLLLTDGVVVSLRQRGLEVAMDPAALQRAAEARLATLPGDPAAILRLAGLRRALLADDNSAAALAELKALYQRGIAACVARGLPTSHPTRQALQRALFALALDEANEASRRNDPRTLDLLIAARDAAPEPRGYVIVQAQVLDRCTDDMVRRRAELDRLEREAGDATMPDSNLPVRAHVAWQRALLKDLSPEAAVAAWQALLENHGDAALPGGTAAAVAEAAIARLVTRHGAAVYAAIGERADKALAAAGDDDAALRDVSARFPNGKAAITARLRLLDRSVARGDLAQACAVLAQEHRAGSVRPGILRRVAVAATARGNLALASTVAERLRPFADMVSDWPADHGASFGTALAAMPKSVPPAPTSTVELPAAEITRIQARTAGRDNHLAPTIVPDGFESPADRPLLAMIGRELAAIDVMAPTTAKPVLWSQPVELLAHVVVCGTVVVAPDFEHVFGLDHRTGRVLWELPNTSGLLFDSLGVTAGVLHVVAFSQSGSQVGGELIGLEPLTGTVLFRISLGGDRVLGVPKPAAGHLIALETAADGALRLHRLDPLTGDAVRIVTIADAALREQLRSQAEELATRRFPQRLCADDARVYLPIDGNKAPPSIAAISDAGATAWQWQGKAGNRIDLAKRGDRLVVIETNEQRPGRVLLLATADGSVIREATLGPDAHPLNWESSWLPNPAPAILALSDRVNPPSRQRRLVAFGVDDGEPTFEIPLGPDDGEIERQPLFGRDFVTFGVRSASRAPFKLYSVRKDRSGALPNGSKFRRLDVPGPHGLGSFGPYTLVTSATGIVLLGAAPEQK